MSAGRVEPGGEFLPLRLLTGAPAGLSLSKRDPLSRRLERAFAGNPAALQEAAARLEGLPAGRDPSGGLAWLFRPLPKIPLKMVYHPADEEFEAEFRLLFDSTAIHFMEFEALAFLTGLFASEMTRQGEALDSGGSA
jgi:hypothetical protein